ncbi:AMP-dependent synthetase/ligase [Ferrovibrio sp.]|uniref:AMP-dependent synthetase/ligase n=1 Tax=Ferrovibrio sp. TaxID=1917215 RepID=UPI003D28B946
MNEMRHIGREAGPILIDGCDTLARLFLKRVEQWGDRTALREKNFGVWESYTWRDFHRHASAYAAGLVALGMRPGDVVAILSEDNKEWVFTDMAVHLANGTVNGVYPTYQAEQLHHILEDSTTRWLFVEDEEQLDKYLSIADRLPGVERVFVVDWKGLRNFSDERVWPISRLEELGTAALAKAPDLLDARIAAGHGEQPAVLVYTSGTTGKPKGARISHRALLFQMTAVPDPFAARQGDELLTYLPLCHLAERVVSLCIQLRVGTVLNFAESSESVFLNIRELSPTILFAVPRIWEKFYSRIATLMDEATWIGHAGYNLAMRIGRRRARLLMQNEQPSRLLDAAFRIADFLVFRNIKQELGLDRTRIRLSGAAPISVDLLEWYVALGLPVSEVYGQTETGIATFCSPGSPPGHVGLPMPGVELKLGAQDEILVRSPGNFSGYLNMPEATTATLVDGWVHTGDVGALLPGGELKITDRLKDIIITAGGKNVTPSLLENRLKFSSYISDAVVVGDRRKYLACLIMIDRENVEAYAQKNAIPFSNFRSLCARPEIVGLIGKVVKEANEQFSSVEQIKAFRLIDVMLTAEDDELTPTMKLKRSFVERKYSELIKEMYRSSAA